MTLANIRKFLALALVVALTMLPMATLAEGAGAEQVTFAIGNFDIGINDAEPIHVDASFKTSLGIGEDSFRYENELTSDGRSVAHIEAALKDGALLLTANGLSSAYSITLEELEQLMQYATAEMPFDAKLLENFIVAYANLIAKADELQTEKQHPMATFEKAGIPVESKPEAAEVMGETLELTRYDFELHTADIDKLIAVSAEEMPELKAYMDAYIDLIAAISAAEGTDMPTFDKDHLFESMMATTGGDISFKCTMWTDESGDNTRMEFTEIIAVEADGETESIAFPFVLMQKTDADGTVHMQMDMDMQPDASSAVNMSMLMNTGAEKGDMMFAMDVKDGATGLTSIAFNMDYDADSFQMTMGANVPEGDDVTDVLFSMSGAAKDDTSARIELALSAGQGEQKLFSGSLGFDVAIEMGALSDAPLLAEGKPVVNITEMTEEQLLALQNEGTTLGLTSLGALMANPGIAKIMADIASFAEAAAGSGAFGADAAIAS